MRAFVELMQALLDEGTYPAIATHDPVMIDATKALREEQGLRERSLRVPDALRHPSRSADVAGEGRLSRARLRAVRQAVVSVLHAPAGRAAGECGVRVEGNPERPRLSRRELDTLAGTSRGRARPAHRGRSAPTSRRPILRRCAVRRPSVRKGSTGCRRRRGSPHRSRNSSRSAMLPLHCRVGAQHRLAAVRDRRAISYGDRANITLLAALKSGSSLRKPRQQLVDFPARRARRFAGNGAALHLQMAAIGIAAQLAAAFDQRRMQRRGAEQRVRRSRLQLACRARRGRSARAPSA